METSQGRVCQSCGLPLSETRRFGTNTDGSPNLEYCTYCFQSGQFTSPAITKVEMIDVVTNFWAQRNHVPLPEARRAVEPMVSQLKRWRSLP